MIMKISKKIIKPLTVIVTILVLAGIATFIFGNHGSTIPRDSSRVGAIVKSSSVQVSQSLEQVAETDNRILLFDGTDCSFAVEDKTTKTRWYSNPLKEQVEKLGLNDSSKKVINSQLVIHYTNSIQQEIRMDSASFSISLKQYTASKIDGGVLVTYSFAYPDSEEVFPRALSIERYDALVKSMKFTADKNLMKKMYALIDRSKLKDEELTKLKDRYGLIETKNIYILRDGQLNTANKKNLTKLFTTIGYSAGQLKKDLDEVLFKGGNGSGESYTIPVKYVLEDDGLRVSIDCSQIKYTETDSGFFPLTGIDLLDYFGCTTQQDEGYLFVPDGSGSLIDFEQRNNRNTTLEGYIYGRDKAILSTADSSITENFTMPVYGIKDQKGAILAVVEEGDAMARIRVNTGGDGIPYNRIGVSFDTMNKDYIPIGETATRENFFVYSNDLYKGTFAVKYYFLSGEDKGVSQMADAYRGNLLSRGKLTKNTAQTYTSLVMELQGAIDVTKTFAGLPYKTTMALTDFNDVKDIIKTLKDEGIENPAVNYTGIFKGGYKTTVQSNFVMDRSLGNANNLKSMTSYLKQNGVNLYGGADFYKIGKESILLPFNKKTDAVRNLTKEVFQSGSNYLLSPVRFEEIIKSYMKGARIDGIEAISPVDMGRTIYSDFNPGRPVSRQESLAMLQKSLKSIKDDGVKLLSDGANSYMFEFANLLSDVPYEDSSYIISSESVPFYQMVVHGYIDYAGKPINYDSEPEKGVLKSVMTGSVLSYKLIGKSSEVLKDTDYSDLYASGFGDWKENIIKWNKKTLPYYKSIKDQKITGYTVLDKDITLTEFEKTSVIVNLSEKPYVYKNVTIKPVDFYWFEGVAG